MKISRLIFLSVAGGLSVLGLRAQTFAPDALNNVVLSASITGSTGGAASSGSINSLLSGGTDYTLQGSGALTDPVAFSYSKSSPTQATLTEGASGALPGVRVALAFTSAAGGNFTATYDGGSTQTGTFTLTAFNSGMAAPLVNVSTLTNLPANSSAITGFVIGGTSSHKVLIRAVGPTLSSYGVTNVLPNPTITLWAGSTAMGTNDDWNSGSSVDATLSGTFTQVGAFPLPSGSKDSAMIVTLPPGIYSAEIKSAAAGDSGRVLMEVYLVQ